MQTNKLNSVLILTYKVFKEVILSFLNLNITIIFKCLFNYSVLFFWNIAKYLNSSIILDVEGQIEKFQKKYKSKIKNNY